MKEEWMNERHFRVMRSIFAVSDETEYNLYESADIAEYARMDPDEVESIIRMLYDEGYLGECMNIGDDGYETFYLNTKGRRLIGVE